VTAIKKGIRAMKENNTPHSTDAAALFSMETHISQWDIKKSSW
jgi:hypothetical protein